MSGMWSHPARGGWIEMVAHPAHTGASPSPTPHGVGGLKYSHSRRLLHPACPTPHGVGGLKLGSRPTASSTCRPTPHGVGGLKYKLLQADCRGVVVPPRTGWVD